MPSYLFNEIYLKTCYFAVSVNILVFVGQLKSTIGIFLPQRGAPILHHLLCYSPG